MSKIKKESRCETCKNLDTEKSNDDWIVCKFQPVPVEVLLNPESCKKYEQVDA